MELVKRKTGCPQSEQQGQQISTLWHVKYTENLNRRNNDLNFELSILSLISEGQKQMVHLPLISTCTPI